MTVTTSSIVTTVVEKVELKTPKKAYFMTA